MPITQIPSSFITKQPKIFVYTNLSAASGTYYTALDTTCRCKVSKITLTNDSFLNNYLNIRVTIDGVINTFSSPTSNYSIGINHNTISSSSYNAIFSYDYFCDILFFNSCKVEFMQNGGGSVVLYGSIMYSTE